MSMKTIDEIRETLKARGDRSAWDKGVTAYALMLLREIEENRKRGHLDLNVNPLEIKSEALNGAKDWDQYSWGGSALAYDYDISHTLCTPSELKRTHDGARRPNALEEWLDVQARALDQAFTRIIRAAR